MRMSKKILLKKMGFLCDKLGKTIGIERGQWNLDYIQSYGGYIVVEYMEKGGEHHPLLKKRLTADKMSDALDFALNAVLLMEKTEK